jgi:hypothetical protein
MKFLKLPFEILLGLAMVILMSLLFLIVNKDIPEKDRY